MVNEQVVHILLECILVYLLFYALHEVMQCHLILKYVMTACSLSLESSKYQWIATGVTIPVSSPKGVVQGKDMAATQC